MQYNDEQKQMIQEIVDYIAKLPVGTVITTMGVMEKIFPDKKDDIWESRMYMGVDLCSIIIATVLTNTIKFEVQSWFDWIVKALSDGVIVVLICGLFVVIRQKGKNNVD